ncbi:MAG: hypothetical protein JWO84_463 [Parcubacteria group bacterium]|nr:hypothetical protein [Parcubacteria group bacterium]
MIPQFPDFKQLEFSDKDELETFAAGFSPYSDFEFASLWAWNVQENMELSLLRKNLVVRFTDYVTGAFFYTFLGKTELNDTAEELIALSEKKGYGSVLHLIPEEAITGLDTDRFDITESRDHFDYLYEVEQHVTYGGGKLKSRRNFLNGFLKTYPHYGAVPLDLSDELTRREVLELCRRWEENKGFPIPNEQRALSRFLDVAHFFTYSAVGITIDSTLVGFCTTVLLRDGRANALFEKVDIRYHGIHALLRHEVAKNLIRARYTHLNYEQDLGILSLRQSKTAFNPTGFLKKYSVSRKRTDAFASQTQLPAEFD